MSLEYMNIVFEHSMSKGVDRFVLLMICDSMQQIHSKTAHHIFDINSVIRKTGLTSEEVWESIKVLSFLKELSVYEGSEDNGLYECWFTLPNPSWRQYRDEEQEEFYQEKTPREWLFGRADYEPKYTDQSGYVYLIESNGVYKIGMAKDVSNRLEQIYPVMPYPVSVIHTIYTNDRRLLETELHEQFAPKRLNGEWFDLAPDDVEYIKSLQDVEL